MKILMVEDDQSIIDAVTIAFEFRWPEAVVISSLTGNNVPAMVREESPDIVLLDLNLPNTTGFEVLDQIRSFSNVPIIMLTVRSADEDVMRALEAGADDYITKPFNYMTLLSRVRAVHRRATMMPGAGGRSTFVNSRLTVDFVDRVVKVDNRVVKLTQLEYKLLLMLIKNKNKLVSYESIASEVWNGADDADKAKVKIAIGRLRRKLRDIPPQIILNARGEGYLLKA
ncbi:MAG: response regulator transcription factor [Spirochaetales bacterium]|nr:response regulator transcription factor [Spirochaetales bacterium]